MKIKSEKDFWSGVMFVTVGLGFGLGALNYKFGTNARPGPGYFPFGLGMLLAILGAIEIVKSLVVGKPDGDRIGPWAWKPLGVILGAVAVFGVALPSLGMVVTIPLLVFVSALAGDEFKWSETLINSVILTVTCWVVFMWGLNLTIPLWPKALVG